MAYNSIYHSVDPDWFQKVSEFAMREPVSSAIPPNIIVVVGAGASNAACGLPTGNEAAQRLRDEISGSALFGGATLVNDEIDKLTLQFNLDEPDFETILLALSRFNTPYLLQRLRSIFGRRHHPWFGYEMLAHCLKHRFIDAIINFHFDELLDQAITDELDDGAYNKIILDGDCPATPDEWFNNAKGKFRLPLYIKPHGSASEPSSLRFTRDSYTALPNGFNVILRTLFAADRPVQILVL